MVAVNLISNNGHPIHDYLAGESFSENLAIDLPPSGPVVDRVEVLASIARGKDVVHLGCCDHIQSLAARRKNGRWLHDHLVQSANICVGVDIDASAVDFVSGELKVPQVKQADMTDRSSASITAGKDWDLLMIPEVLEHIGDPVSFLSKIRTVHGDRFEKAVISVPNAFRGGSFRNALKQREVINSDHRFYFTPYTLLKVVADSGLEAQTLTFASFSEMRGRRGKLKQCFLNRYPLLAEDLILTCSFR